MLACGYEGKGRMAEPAEIVEYVLPLLEKTEKEEKQAEREADFAGKKILVTAGPTVEHIDPVRYISNRSSGRMGFAVAEAARSRGAEVTLVSGSRNSRMQP